MLVVEGARVDKHSAEGSQRLGMKAHSSGYPAYQTQSLIWLRMVNLDQSQSATEKSAFEVTSSETFRPHQCFWEGTGLCEQQRGANLPLPDS